MLQSEIVVVLLIFIPRSYKSQNSYIGLVVSIEYLELSKYYFATT